jgi:hypothetical protein
VGHIKEKSMQATSTQWVKTSLVIPAKVGICSACLGVTGKTRVDSWLTIKTILCKTAIISANALSRKGGSEMKINLFVVIIVSILTLTIAGCGTYYKITEPGSGRVYYTDDIERKNGSIEFKDAKTGSTVTLQNSEVLKISKEDYKRHTPQK